MSTPQQPSPLIRHRRSLLLSAGGAVVLTLAYIVTCPTEDQVQRETASLSSDEQSYQDEYTHTIKTDYMHEQLRGKNVLLEEVEFGARGELRGVVLGPKNRSSQRLPALVVAGPMGAIKEMVNFSYAKYMAVGGYRVLIFDYRHFGESKGEPRQRINPFQQIKDLREAVTYLSSRADVDPARIGALGVCMGGGIALHLAAVDSRIRALVSVAGGFTNDTVIQRTGSKNPEELINMATLDESPRQLKLERLRHAKEYAEPALPAISAPAPTMRLVSKSDAIPAVMRPPDEPYEYYLRASSELGTKWNEHDDTADATQNPSTNWLNVLTLDSFEFIPKFNALDIGLRLTSRPNFPILFIHGGSDRYTPRKLAEAAYFFATGIKTMKDSGCVPYDENGEAPAPQAAIRRCLILTESKRHIDFYDDQAQSPSGKNYVEYSTKLIRTFLHGKL